MPEMTPEIERELAALDDALAGRRVAPDLTELGELALALREERPRPTEGFGRYLDNRVERGFPGRDPRVGASRSGRSWWQAFMTVPAFGMAAAVLLVAVIVVADPAGDSNEGGGGGGASLAVEESTDSTGATSAQSADAAPRSTSAGDESAGGTTAAEPDSGTEFAEPLPSLGVPPVPGSGSPGSDGRGNRAVERSASLTLAARPRDIDGVSRRIQDKARDYGGFVLSSSVTSSPTGGGGDFQLRIPERNLDAAVAALSRLARVRERSQGAQDITAERVSARTRLRDARTERKSLLRQLAAADTPNETASIRQRLDIVSNEIEAARAAVRRVMNRANFATVSVTLVADRNAGAVGPDEDDNWTPGDAADDALRVLEVAAGIALIVLAVALPLALLAILAGLAARWTRRRRREHALDAV